MRLIILFAPLLFLSTILFSQSRIILKPENHAYYISTLSSAKDSAYNQIIKLYNDYLKSNPANYLVQIEKCELIDKAYYDEYDDYNPKYEEFDACLKDLTTKFPPVPEVLLYRADHLYGDSAKVFLEKIVKDYDNNPLPWTGKGIWRIHEKIAQQYEDDKFPFRAIKYAELAQKENDTLDMSLFLSQQYKKQKQTKKAVDILFTHLDSTDAPNNLNEKGKMLLELGAPDKALKAFQFAHKDTTAWIDSGNLAQALMENGLTSEARQYLVKDAASTWSHPGSLQKLLQYDIHHSPADTAMATYRRLVNENFWYDALGINRITLFWYEPGLGWNLYDVIHIILLILLFLVTIIIPYLWILPIYTMGLYLKKNKGLFLPTNDFRWGLKHFWIISSVWLCIDILTSLIFDYDNLIALYTGNQSNNAVENTVNQNEANLALFFFISSLFVTISFLRKSDLSIFWGSLWTKRKSIGIGVGLALSLKFALSFYQVMYRAFNLPITDTSTILSINENILSINEYYHPLVGFLFVVIIVPVYEEVIFRGIILSSIEKHLKFYWANIIQALIFAAIHQQLKLLPFYFLFGISAGYYRSKSQSLAPGIVLHMLNNFIAFMAILWLGDRIQSF